MTIEVIRPEKPSWRVKITSEEWEAGTEKDMKKLFEHLIDLKKKYKPVPSTPFEPED